MGIILGGGGSGQQTIITNKLFESLTDNNKPILYIPLAMEPNRYDGCLTWINGEFNNIKHGNIVMVKSASEILEHDLSDYAAIFIGGGNTYRLLKRLKDSGAFERIKQYVDNGGLVYGGSAGAIIFGKDIDVCLYMDTNDVELKNTTGFDLLFGFSFTAHYTNQKLEEHVKAMDYLTTYSVKEPIVALPEEDSLYTDGKMVKIIGTKPWYIFNHGKNKQLNPDIEYTRNEFINIVNH